MQTFIRFCVTNFNILSQFNKSFLFYRLNNIIKFFAHIYDSYAPIAGQTAEPNWMELFLELIGNPGVFSQSVLKSTGNLGYFTIFHKSKSTEKNLIILCKVFFRIFSKMKSNQIHFLLNCILRWHLSLIEKQSFYFILNKIEAHDLWFFWQYLLFVKFNIVYNLFKVINFS